MPRLWAKNEVTKMKQIWKRLFAMLLTLALIASTLTIAAAETVYGICTDDNVNVRKQGTSGAKIWFKVDEGHVAQIIGTVEEDGVIVWYKINTAHPQPNGHTYIGYISADYFRPMTKQETDAYLADNDLLPPVEDPEDVITPTPEPTEEPTLRPSTDDALNGATGYEGVEVVGAKGKTLGGTNFRDLPSTKTGKIIGTIPGKTVIDILAVPANGGEWYCVSYNGKVGFVHQGMVNVLDAGATVTPTIAPPVVDDGHTEYKGTEVVGAKGVTLGITNFRTEPSTTTGKVITSIPAGTEIDINAVPEEGSEDPWYRIRYQDRSGYVHANMVKLTAEGTAPTPDPGFGTEVTDTWGEITADDVRFRYDPSTEAAVIRKFAEGTEVEVLTVPDAIDTKYWYRVRHDGVVGYVQSNYVRITKTPVTPEPILPPADEEDTDVTNSTGEITADGVNFRQTPSAEAAIWGKLNRGTVVELLVIPAQVDANHWYKVKYNGLTGYIQAPFIRVLTLDPDYLPAPEKYGYAKLTESSANLRLEPAGSTVLTWKGKGSLLPIVGASELKSGFQWYPVHYTANSTVYYVREDMIQVVLLQNGEQVTPTPEPESEFGYVITTTYGVNLRLKANGDEVITQIPRNTILTCVGEAVKPTGSQYWWYCVKYNGMIGYVRGDCVKVCSSYGGPVSATPTPKPTEKPDTETVRGYIRLTKTDVALRVFPLQAVQTRLPKGLILPVVGAVVPADTYGQYCWYYVRTADGLNGYIRGDCAVSCYPEGDEIPNTPTPKPGGSGDLVGATGKMLKNTNFREKPSSASNSAIMTVIKAGTIVEVLSIPEDTKYGWYKIRYNGKTGYVYGTLIQMVTYGEEGGEETEKPSAFGYVMITDKAVNLRDGVGGKTLTQLDKGTVWPMTGLTVTKDGVDWYPIRAKGYTGYVHEDYAFKLSPEQEDAYLNGGTVPSVTPGPSDEMSSYLIITDDKVNLRESYSLDAPKPYQVNKGTVLRYLGSKDQGTVTWHNVVYEGQELWVHEDYSRVMPQAEYENWLAGNPDADPDLVAPLGYVKVTKDYAPVRSTANGKTVLATLRVGAVLPFYQQNISAGGYRWYRVQLSTGEYGYIATTLVEACDQEGEDLPTPEPDQGGSSSTIGSSQQETDYTDLKQGSTGIRVTNLVTELINQGYYQGAVTSTFTSAVKAAVEAFQRANGLTVDGIAGDKTQHKLFGTVPIGSGDTTNLDFAIYPVEKIDWFEGGIQEMLPRGANFKVYDVKTGIVWWAHRWAGSRHADIETLTAADSARLCQIYGVSNLQQIVDDNMWQRRPCLITIGTRTFAASLDGMQHGTDTIPNNGMNGQICLHFTNSQGHSSQAVSTSHKEAIEYAYNHCPAGKK